MKKELKNRSVWSYSLFGDDFETYYIPLIENIIIAREEGALLSISTTVLDGERVLSFFSDYLDEIEIVIHDHPDLCKFPKVLRFLIPRYIDADFYFFKDSDSIVTEREKKIMQEWMNTQNPNSFIIRDHPLHTAPILAGMFGISHVLKEFLMYSAIREFQTLCPKYQNKYSYDQDWLMFDIYPKIVNQSHVYSSFLYYSNEKIHKITRVPNGYDFIGAQRQCYSKLAYENTRYYRFYGTNMLCVPSCMIRFLRGKVRPTLFIAYLYTKLRTKIFPMK